MIQEPGALGCGGSSPRARGTAEHNSEVLGGYRFIPAGAGNGWTPY